MRNPNVCHLVALVAIALAACGPGNKEISAAKAARYKGDKLAIFSGAKAATEAKYKLAKSDETTLGLQTTTRMYDPNGLVAGEHGSEQNSAKTGYNSMYPDNSLAISYEITVLPDGDAWLVHVKPTIERYHAGSPKMEPLNEGDISLPGWVQGKTDSLAFDIHDALKEYEVKSVPGMAPPPTAPGATPPVDEPKPGAGSAAPSASAEPAAPAK